MPLKRLLDLFSSLRLTVVCLGLAIVLVFVGTLAQVNVGIYAAQARYFRSLFVFIPLPGTGLSLPVFPGGYLIGGVLLVNLVCAHFKRFGLAKNKTGLMFVHLGLVLLLLGQLATDLLQVESSMRLTEGEAKNYSEDSRHSELAIIDATNPEFNEVTAIPESALARNKEIRHPTLPFAVRVLAYWPNSTNAPLGTAEGPKATQGLGLRVQFKEMPLTGRTDMRNLPSAYVELVAPTGSLGVWLVSGWLDPLQSFTQGNKTYQIGMRLARYYKPFSLQLAKFSHDKYIGTDIPKNFSSRLRIQRAETGEDREVLVYMNNPLRYGGETFYQAGFDERDDRVTILQVVRNPGWLTPYFSCALVGLGLVVQFMTHLVGFVRKRKAQTL